MNKRLLTFELSTDGQELHVHANAEGVRTLIKALDRLRSQVEAGKQAHDHLMTEAWGGTELSAVRHSADARLVNKVDIHVWPDTK